MTEASPAVPVPPPPSAPPEPPRGALLLVLLGLAGIVIAGGLRDLDDLRERKLARLIEHRQEEHDAEWAGRVQSAPEKQRPRVEQERERESHAVQHEIARAREELARLRRSRARHDYAYAWVGLLARCLLVLGACRLAGAAERRYQVAGLVLVAILAWSLFVQGRVTVQL